MQSTSPPMEGINKIFHFDHYFAPEPELAYLYFEHVNDGGTEAVLYLLFSLAFRETRVFVGTRPQVQKTFGSRIY